MVDAEAAWLSAQDIKPEDLVDRIKAATGPDRELDRLIAIRVGAFDSLLKVFDAEPSCLSVAPCDYDTGRVQVRIAGPSGRGGLVYQNSLPSYTGSLDAIYEIAQKISGSTPVSMAFGEPEPHAAETGRLAVATLNGYKGVAQTPILALCAALVWLRMWSSM